MGYGDVIVSLHKVVEPVGAGGIGVHTVSGLGADFGGGHQGVGNYILAHAVPHNPR